MHKAPGIFTLGASKDHTAAFCLLLTSAACSLPFLLSPCSLFPAFFSAQRWQHMPVGRVAPGGGRAAATPVSTPAKLPLGTPGTREINSCTANNPLQLPSGGQFPWGRVPVPFLVPVRADGPVHLIACSILASTWLLHSNPSGRRGVQEPGEERRSRAWREEYRILERRRIQDPGEERSPGVWRRDQDPGPRSAQRCCHGLDTMAARDESCPLL